MCVCVSLLSLACLLGGSAIAHSTASCFLPLLLEKDFRPPKGVIPNAKQHWQQPSFLACIFNPPCATKVAFWFFPSLFTLTHTHSPSQDRILLLFSSLQSLLIGIQHCPVRLHLPVTKHQTGSTQPGRSGLCKHWWSSQQPTTNGWTPTSHICHFISSSSPVDTRIHTRRSIRRQPLEISRNISLTLLIRPGFSTPGGGTPPSSCPGIH